MIRAATMRIPFPDFSERKTRDAARLAIQSAVAAAAAFSILQAAGMPQKFVGVLSAVLVVQPTIGSTLGEAWQRFAATLTGCVIGVTCLVLLPSGYGTAAAVALSVFVMHLVAGWRPEWRYGVVAALALAIGSGENLTQTAIDRSLAIGVGVLVGAAVTLFIWPDRSPKRAERHLRAALRATADRLDVTVKATQGKGSGQAEDERSRFHHNFALARDAVEAARFADTEGLKKKAEAVERLYNSVIFLNRVAEESDGPLPFDEEVEDHVDTIRSCGCEIAQGIAGGKGDLRGRLDKIQAALAEVRDSVARHRGDPEIHILLNALVFGLDEVEDSLKELLELYGEVR